MYSELKKKAYEISIYFQSNLWLSSKLSPISSIMALRNIFKFLNLESR